MELVFESGKISWRTACERGHKILAVNQICEEKKFFLRFGKFLKFKSEKNKKKSAEDCNQFVSGRIVIVERTAAIDRRALV